MKVLLETGYSDIDGSFMFVRDSAYDTAADDDLLLLWNTEQGYTYGDGEEFTFPKKALQVIEYDSEYEKADDPAEPVIVEEEVFSPREIQHTVENTGAETQMVASEVEDTDFIPGDTVVVSLQGTVQRIDDGAVVIRYTDGDSSYHDIELFYTDESFREIKKIPRPLVHPPVGHRVLLHTTNRNTELYGPGEYMRGADGYYHGVHANTLGMKLHMFNPDIAKITKL